MKSPLIVRPRLLIAGLWAVSSSLVIAQETLIEEIESLPSIVVVGKAENLLGETDTASKGRATQEDFLSRPLLRRGEILETIPGMIITQHAGGGKANQYFLRGFNLDHGTDFAVSMDGMPLNMRTHAHGQGYTDLNVIIPELIQAIDYAKGTYTAADGDLSSAGSANFLLWDVLPQNILTLEYGSYNYARALVAGTLPLSSEVAKDELGLTYALEHTYYDGPWDNPEDSTRWNGQLRLFAGDEENGWSVTYMGYRGEWTSTDQIPQRAIDSGLVGRFGTLDPTAGGLSTRHSLNAEWHHREDDVVTRANVYAIHYSLELFSNFTYFMDFPLPGPPVGDQFEQSEDRWVFGGQVARTWENREIFGKPGEVTLGLQTRHDVIDGIGLYRTQARNRHTTVREDDIFESSIGLYAEMTNHWTPWFRTVLGLRGDLFHFDVSSSLSQNSGNDWAGLVNPKFSAILGPWHDTEFYLNFGTGFHSNDARGVTNTVDPTTGPAFTPVMPVDALVRTYGAEIGMRTQAIPTLTLTSALFWLRSESELLYVGDAGTNEPGPGSDRFGVELAAYWRPSPWFGMDGELALTHGRLRGQPGMDRIPNSVPVMFNGGMTLGAQGGDEGFFAGLRARVLGPRPLEETGTVESRALFMLNGTIGYRRGDWEAAVDVLNILGRKDNDIEYSYQSLLAGEAPPAPPDTGIDDRHLHPVEPRMVRVRFTWHF